MYDKILEGLSNMIECNSKYIRFFVARMLYKLNIKRRLTMEEQKRIFNRCPSKNWFKNYD